MHSFRGFSKRYMRDIASWRLLEFLQLYTRAVVVGEFLNLRRKTLNLIFKLNLIADFAAAENPNYG
jgi:hypothetical protein